MLESRRPLQVGTRGFSLIEMMVALLFMGILMAGMTGVFRSSISSFVTAGEKVSSTRRNRLAIDLLYDDLNSAGMFLSAGGPPIGGSACPLFFILPNQAIPGYLVDGQQQYADELYMYMDQPLPFLGQLAADMPGSTAQDTANNTPPTAAETNFNVVCPNVPYANQIYSAAKTSLSVCFMDSGQIYPINPIATQPTTPTVPVALNLSPGQANFTGRGATPNFKPHLHNCNLLFFIPAQMVRYSVQMVQLDADAPAGVPCLVRQQANYDPNGFPTATAPVQIITENLGNNANAGNESAHPIFKVYMSPSPGYLSVNLPAQTWAPFNPIADAPNLDTGWTQGVLADFNTQMASAGRPGLAQGTNSLMVNTGDYAGGMAWFRLIPVVLRLDITTQTATQRTEYSSTGTTLANAYLTQSLVITPRNFGLPLD